MEVRATLGLGGEAELLTRAVGSGDLKTAANKRSNLGCEITPFMSLFNTTKGKIKLKILKNVF